MPSAYSVLINAILLVSYATQQNYVPETAGVVDIPMFPDCMFSSVGRKILSLAAVTTGYRLLIICVELWNTPDICGSALIAAKPR